MNVLTAGEASVVCVSVVVKSVNVAVAVVVVRVGVDESVAEVESELVSVGKESVAEVEAVGEVVSVVRGVVDNESVVKLSVAKLLVGNVSVVKVSVVDESVNVVVGTSVVLGILSVVVGILLRMDAAKNKLTGSTDVPQPIVTVFVLVFVVVFVTVFVHPDLVYVIGQSDLFGDEHILVIVPTFSLQEHSISVFQIRGNDRATSSAPTAPRANMTKRPRFLILMLDDK
ncbi:hypothetical protein RhiJN_21448 [Ceratobasidium sp. AG-Ba]|nr:hypothetical protein RhiJN_21448 [Ceratobasidium sp. AG-Ba]